MKIKHKHDWLDKFRGTTKIPMKCRLCSRTFYKGRKTPNGAFGKSGVLR